MWPATGWVWEANVLPDVSVSFWYYVGEVCGVVEV